MKSDCRYFSVVCRVRSRTVIVGRKPDSEWRRLHAKISDTRRNTLQQFTTKIIRENEAIFVEGLNVVGMAETRILPNTLGTRHSPKYFVNWNTRRNGMAEPICHWTGFFRRRNCVRLVDICWMNCRYQFVSGTVQLAGVHHGRDIKAAINIKLSRSIPAEVAKSYRVGRPESNAYEK